MAAKVYLIGAGPGDPDLLTVKGLNLIRQASVIIYDYLASETLLAHAKADTRLIYVGKKGFSKHITQEEINRIIVDEARSFSDDAKTHVVVRLKGGDPYVFGRGGEEALVLAREHIPFEVVPGVTSGIAAPACAGIPVTHRGISTSVAFITGNEDPTKKESDIDWDGIAHGAQTLCFYMGIKNLPSIASKLIEAGKSPDTPVALIRWGTTPLQEELVATLATVADRAREANFQAPAIIVVGEVASLRESLGSKTAPPLAGKSIAVTRSRTQASQVVSQLRALGAQVVECPTIQIQPLEDYSAIDGAIEALAANAYEWVVLTSTNGVECFFTRLAACGFDARVLAGAKIAAIGPATAAELERHGIRADIVPGEYRGESVVEEMLSAGAQAGQHVLLARASKAREVIPATLREAGLHVDVAPLYRTVPARTPQSQAAIRKILAGEIDAVTFTSSSTVSNFMQLAREGAQAAGMTEEELKEVLGKLECYSIGPITTSTMSDFGLVAAAQAQVYTIPGLIEAITLRRLEDRSPRIIDATR